MYEILLFDLDNTLLDFDLAEDIALTNLLEKYKVDDIESYKSYYLPMNKDLWHRLDKKEITREYLVKNRFRLLFENFGIKVDGEKLANDYKKLLGMQGQHIKGAVELLDKLKKQGYRMFVVTNGLIDIQENRLKNSKIKEYFEDIFISEKIGYQKPYNKFFEYVEKNISNFSKEKVLMIGDNLYADIKGAKDYKIDTAWINFKKDFSKKDIIFKYEILNYKQLEEILL